MKAPAITLKKFPMPEFAFFPSGFRFVANETSGYDLFFVQQVAGTNYLIELFEDERSMYNNINPTVAHNSAAWLTPVNVLDTGVYRLTLTLGSNQANTSSIVVV